MAVDTARPHPLSSSAKHSPSRDACRASPLNHPCTHTHHTTGFSSIKAHHDPEIRRCGEFHFPGPTDQTHRSTFHAFHVINKRWPFTNLSGEPSRKMREDSPPSDPAGEDTEREALSNRACMKLNGIQFTEIGWHMNNILNQYEILTIDRPGRGMKKPAPPTSIDRIIVVLCCVAFGITWMGAGRVAAAPECVETSPADAQAAIEDARRAVITLEYESTLAKLEEVRRSLPCLTGTIPTETIAQLYFYEGLFKLNLGKEEEADQAFYDAAAVMPLLQEEREHATAVRERWAAAREAVTRDTGTLVIPDLPADAIAYVDGRPLQEGSQTATVYPGVHLLQVWGDDKKLHGTLMRVRPGETSLVSAEFLASLTPRGELVLDIQPRGAKVTIRQGSTVVYSLDKARRRTLLSDVKEGAYIVEVEKGGFYPFSQGKVAVEGGDQTLLKVVLQRRPSLSLNLRGGAFWVDAAPSDTDPLGSVELVGRTSSGWGFHLEYFHHIQYNEADGGEPPEFSPNEEFTTNRDYDGDGQSDPCESDDSGCVWENGPPEFPNVTTVGLPLGARMYLGVSRQFRIEGVDVSLGSKLAMSLWRSSLFGEVNLGYDFAQYFGIHLRAGLGGMMHVNEPYLFDNDEPEGQDADTTDYVRFGLIGMLNAGIRVGF